MSQGTKRDKGEGTAGAKDAPLGVEGMRQSGVEFRLRRNPRSGPPQSKKALEARVLFRIFVEDKCRFFVAALLRMTIGGYCGV